MIEIMGIVREPNGRTKIADDTWRTAGDAQKVASGFGDDMKKCVAGSVDKDRASKKK